MAIIREREKKTKLFTRELLMYFYFLYLLGKISYSYRFLLIRSFFAEVFRAFDIVG